MQLKLIQYCLGAIIVLLFFSCKGKGKSNTQGKQALQTVAVKNNKPALLVNNEKRQTLYYFEINQATQLQIPDSLENKYPVVFNDLQRVIQENTSGVNFQNTITFKLTKAAFSTKPKSFFEIDTRQKKIVVKARTVEGLINGSTRLQKEIKNQDGKLKTETITDWSVLDVRALSLIVWGKEELKDMKELIDLARHNYYNTLVIDLNGNVVLHDVKQTKGVNRWPQKEFKKLIEYAKKSGFEVIAQVKLLSGQKKRNIGHAYPQYLLNNTTYNPKAKGLYTNAVFPMLQEVLSLTGASKLHISHAEVAGFTKYGREAERIGKGNSALSPTLFLKDIKTINSFLNQQGVTTIMSGDMLLSPKQFPKMEQGFLHGVQGYAELINKIPKDIIIVDWHYRDKQKEFPSYIYLAGKGFEVWGATWKRFETTQNFTNYVVNSSVELKGMMATTWYGMGRYDEIKKIIVDSGQIFWNKK